MKETRKGLSVSELQEQIQENQNKIRELKRSDSEVNIQMRQEQWTSEEPKEVKENLTACYAYIAQHRLLVRNGKFKKLDGKD